jgi:5'-3' exonuclease
MKDFTNILDNLKETPPPELNDHILIIDAMNTLIRSFSLLKAMNPSGAHVGGLVGFMRSLGFLTRTIEPTRIFVVWDGKGGSANRKNMNSDYKANRATMRITHWGLYDTKKEETEALVSQIYRTQDYLECLPVQQMMLEKLEADDIIAYLAKNTNKKVTIVSSDKDFLQLVSPNVEVYSPIKKKTLNMSNIVEDIQVIPENYNVIKALLGDNSDGLSGVKGLGIKTILSEFPDIVNKPGTTLDYIFEVCEAKIEEKKPKKIFAKILSEWDNVETNFKMMDLHETMLDDKEKDHILNIVNNDIPDLQVGAFLRFLDQDQINGITKNTEGWLETFRPLTVFNKE